MGHLWVIRHNMKTKNRFLIVWKMAKKRHGNIIKKNTIKLSSKHKLSLPPSFAEHKGWTQACALRKLEICESSTNRAGVRMKHPKPSDPAPTVNRACVYVCTHVRGQRGPADSIQTTTRFHHSWQQNLLAFPCSPTNGLLTCSLGTTG